MIKNKTTKIRPNVIHDKFTLSVSHCESGVLTGILLQMNSPRKGSD